jgi:hypothetical protein
MTLYQLSFKRKLVESGFIEAISLEKAYELGRKYCDENQVRFIAVKDAILVREEVVEEVKRGPGRPPTV